MNRDIKIFLFLVLIALQNNLNAQGKDNLVPFYKLGKWGYCNDELKQIIEPKFDNAYPFYNNLGHVEMFKVDTFWTNKFYNQYFTYTKTFNTLINSKGEQILKPFEGFVEMYSNCIIIRYCFFFFESTRELDKKGNYTGNINYWKNHIIDSSIVIKYNGETLLPMRIGEYTYVKEDVLRYEPIVAIGDATDYNVEYFYKDTRFWQSSLLFKVPQIICNNDCCYYQDDSSTTIINYKGEVIARFNSKHKVLNDKIQFINNIDSYYLLNNKGDTLEHSTFWEPSFSNYNAIIRKIENEWWRAPLLPFYRFEEYYVLNNKFHLSWLLCKTNSNLSNIYLINRSNTFLKIGPFETITSFYNGFAFVKYNNEYIRQLNEKGEFTDLKIDLKNVLLENEKLITTDINPYYIKIKEKKMNENTYYYLRVDGKKYVIN
jgi:hypothetical protein